MAGELLSHLPAVNCGPFYRNGTAKAADHSDAAARAFLIFFTQLHQPHVTQCRVSIYLAVQKKRKKQKNRKFEIRRIAKRAKKQKSENFHEFF